MRFTLPNTQSARLVKLFDILNAAAEDGKPCPTNEELAVALDYKSWSGPASLLKVLEKRGTIKVERFTNTRRVTIVKTGKETLHEHKHILRKAGPRGPNKISLPVPFDLIVNRLPVSCFKCGVRPDYQNPETGEVGCRCSPAIRTASL